MHEHHLSSVSGGQARSGWILASPPGSGAVGIGLLLGVGAAYLLERASTEALATTSRVLLITGVAGLVLMTVVVAARLLDHRPGPGDRPPGHWRIYLVPDAGELRPTRYGWPAPPRTGGGARHDDRALALLMTSYRFLNRLPEANPGEVGGVGRLAPEHHVRGRRRPSLVRRRADAARY